MIVTPAIFSQRGAMVGAASGPSPVAVMPSRMKMAMKAEDEEACAGPSTLRSARLRRSLQLVRR